ncbi:MAG: phage minor head protein [Turicibacter sp.]|nr:phage minor head protein [Turicibacter sp.]
MTDVEKEIEGILLREEKQALKALERLYTLSLRDIKREVLKLQQREQTQSVQYQLQYRLEALRQIEAIVEKLHSGTYDTLYDFVTQTYETSHIGANYSLNKQGIPIMTPINPAEVVSVATRTVEGWTMAQRVGRDMNTFKKSVGVEVIKGINQRLPYIEVAKNLSRVTGESLNSSYRIARTEGGRAQSEGKMYVARDFKSKGADIVKQWNSFLDAKTRPTHQALDQQVQEIEDNFESPSGARGMAPRLFGVASEDINCRCSSNNRARWALEGGISSRLAEVEPGVFEIIDGMTYADYKVKFLKKADEVAEKQKDILRLQGTDLAYNNSGAVSGALNDKNDPTQQKRDDHARLYYDEVRNRDKTLEISTIAKNTGNSEKAIELVYNHVFINEYELENGLERFYPDFYMANSWQRMREGKEIQADDLIMLEHEMYESILMADGMGYAEAHRETERLYNYSREIDKIKGG